ncbi:rhamnulokinase [Paracoccus sp. (in: a-proteobacteria)]|uniref:rhamnulokinase n=1 Tax=Paracoccus sp. TaxID=267 RepID=UPI003A84D587
MTKVSTCCLAFDFGAGSGRAVLAHVRNGRMELAEILRIPGAEVQLQDGPHWDMAALFAHVEQGLQVATSHAVQIASVGVDSWGLDYGLLDGTGHLLAQPRHYRHPGSQRGFAASPFDGEWLAQVTDAQVLPVNTVFQLLDDRATRPALLDRADRLLMIADLVNHHLTGIASNDLTLARTSGLHDWSQSRWSDAILTRAQIPARLFGPLTRPGTTLGPLRPDLARQSGLGPIPVISVAGHDTASAVCGLPLESGEAFMIAGSWNLVGFEAVQPPAGFGPAGFGIEGGAEGRALLIRSLDGLHLMRRLRDDLPDRPGFPQLAAMAQQALGDPPPPLEPADPGLAGTDGFVAAAAAQFRARGLTPVTDAGSLALSLYLGLTDSAAMALQQIDRLRGQPATALRIGGGGAQDAFLCQLLAARLRIPVIAGPVEASAAGNALFQLIGLGLVPSLTEARRIVARSGMTREYRPEPGLTNILKGAPCLPSNVSD